MDHQTEIIIPNGRISCKAKTEFLKKTKCFKCQQEIYIVYTVTGPKLPVTKENGILISHDMRCPHSKLCQEEKRRIQAQKIYEERLKNKAGTKKFRKKRKAKKL